MENNDSLPTVIMVSEQTWTATDGTAHWRLDYEVAGGDVAQEWFDRVRPPSIAWCRISIGSSGWKDVPRKFGGGTWLASYGGEVWPSAWPALFEGSKLFGHSGIRLTEAGDEWLATATRAVAS